MSHRQKNILRILRLLAATILLQAPILTHAIPKAAEHEDAQVVSGAEVAIPKSPAKPAKQRVQKGPVRPAKAVSHNPAHHPKKVKTAHPDK